jgi:hypothetical protein
MTLKHLTAVLPLVLIGFVIHAQQPPAVPAVAGASTADLAAVEGAPNQRFGIPLRVTAAPGVKIGKIELTVAFPKAALTFITAETSGLTDAVEADVSTAVKDNPKDAKQKLLVVTLSTLDGKATRIPFPSGKLVYLAFLVAKAQKPDTMINISATATAVTVDNPPKPVPLVVHAAPVKVTDEPLSACYFYMH